MNSTFDVTLSPQQVNFKPTQLMRFGGSFLSRFLQCLRTLWLINKTCGEGDDLSVQCQQSPWVNFQKSQLGMSPTHNSISVFLYVGVSIIQWKVLNVGVSMEHYRGTRESQHAQSISSREGFPLFIMLKTFNKCPVSKLKHIIKTELAFVTLWLFLRVFVDVPSTTSTTINTLRPQSMKVLSHDSFFSTDGSTKIRRKPKKTKVHGAD